jgi:hypothetical protein
VATWSDYSIVQEVPRQQYQNHQQDHHHCLHLVRASYPSEQERITDRFSSTYYAIASAIPLTLANYVIVGLLSDQVDQFYITSWKIFVGMAVVVSEQSTHLVSELC